MAPPLPISSSIVEDWFHGLYTALVLVTLWLIVSPKNKAVSRKYTQIALVLVPYICSTVHAALNWLWYSTAIDENELPGGPGLLRSLTHIPAWVEGVGDSFFLLNIFLADCVLIWRCWCVWGRRWTVVVLPAMATFSGVVLGGIIISDQVIARRTSEPFTAARKAAEFVNLSGIYFSLSVATSLFTTLLITFRIVLVQRASKHAGLSKSTRGSNNDFNTVIEILVESAVLYSATLLTFVVLLLKKDVSAYYAQNVHAQMAGLAPLLILLRIAAGQSRPQAQWSTTRHASNPASDGSMQFAAGPAPTESTLSMSMSMSAGSNSLVRPGIKVEHESHSDASSV
ncbi:hypothetical protein MKEN_00617700 [Mycena kentingensis (nom. inval.)]|nr:hypothetical protein MKEN_00617700 [Mycena kentingensis (nom. inval.)]